PPNQDGRALAVTSTVVLHGSDPMKESLNTRGANALRVLTALALSLSMAGAASAATPRVDEAQLLELGFKVLVATTTVQERWVKGLAPGQIRPMQRNGK